MAILEERRVAGETRLTIAQVLVERGLVTAAQVRRVLAAQGKELMVCTDRTCGKRFNIRNYRVGRRTAASAAAPAWPIRTTPGRRSRSTRRRGSRPCSRRSRRRPRTPSARSPAWRSTRRRAVPPAPPGSAATSTPVRSARAGWARSWPRRTRSSTGRSRSRSSRPTSSRATTSFDGMRGQIAGDKYEARTREHGFSIFHCGSPLVHGAPLPGGRLAFGAGERVGLDQPPLEGRASSGSDPAARTGRLARASTVSTRSASFGTGTAIGHVAAASPPREGARAAPASPTYDDRPGMSGAFYRPGHTSGGHLELISSSSVRRRNWGIKFFTDQRLR